MPKATQPLYLSPQEAAIHAGVSVDTIRRRIADGTIPAHRLGKRLIRIAAADLEAAFKPIPNARGGASA
jgi:excisionase family DNA binding protein